MPAFADYKGSTLDNNAALTSDAGISVDRTFSPVGYVAPGVAKWNDRSGGIPVGYPVVTLQMRGPTQGSRVYKTTMKIILPTLEQTSPSTATGIQPAPTKAYECTAILEFLIPERSTLNERTALMSLVRTLSAGTVAASDGAPLDNTGGFLRMAVVNFEPPY